MTNAAPHIGTLNEGPLHATLKAIYAGPEGHSEVAIGPHVVDAVRDGVFYEIQTGSFSGLERKLRALADHGPVVLVHPIPLVKTLVKLPERTSRKSPKRGHVSHIVNELVYAPTLLEHPRIAVEVVLTMEEELREYDPAKRRGLGGWRTIERRLVEIADRRRLDHTADLYGLLANELDTPFTTTALAAALDQPLAVAQKMAYCLRHAGVVEISGKQGNSLVYRDTERP